MLYLPYLEIFKMKTLGKTITRHFFIDENGYQKLRKRWSEIFNSPERSKLEGYHHLLYLAFLGKDWTRGFKYSATSKKNPNGAIKALKDALSALGSKYQPINETPLFKGIIRSGASEILKSLLPKEYNAETEPYIKHVVINNAEQETPPIKKNTFLEWFKDKIQENA